MSRPILIVGGQGLLGGALLKLGAQLGLPMQATSRHPPDDSTAFQRLDLAEPLDAWSPPDCQSAILCAAITSLEACRRDPIATRRINVDQTVQLAEKLVAAKCFVVFISSNLVFDGTRPRRQTSEPTCPMTEYGRQKADVERALSVFGNAVAIVRLTKVIHPQWPLICGWIESLRAGKAVRAFADLGCAPIPLETTARGLLTVAQRRQPGGWQFSADSDVSYAGLARHIARRMNCDASLVQAVSSRETAGLEHNPQHTTLATMDTCRELGLVFPSPLSVIDQTFFP